MEIFSFSVFLWFYALCMLFIGKDRFDDDLFFKVLCEISRMMVMVSGAARMLVRFFCNTGNMKPTRLDLQVHEQ